MSGIMHTRYTPVPIGVSATYVFPSGSPQATNGFLAATAGTITITNSAGVVLVNAVPIAAGVYTVMPFYVGTGATITLAGGASGTLAVC